MYYCIEKKTSGWGILKQRMRKSLLLSLDKTYGIIFSKGVRAGGVWIDYIASPFQSRGYERLSKQCLTRPTSNVL